MLETRPPGGKMDRMHNGKKQSRIECVSINQENAGWCLSIVRCFIFFHRETNPSRGSELLASEARIVPSNSDSGWRRGVSTKAPQILFNAGAQSVLRSFSTF